MANNRLPGQLRVANDIGPKSSVATGGFEIGSSGLAEVAKGFAADFAQIGGRIGQMADKAAAREGAEAGAAAGLDPEFRPHKTGTIRGEAYDRAGLEVYLTKAKSEIAADFDEAFDAHGADPKALAEALENKRRTWISSAVPEVRPDLELTMRGATVSLMRQATRAMHARVAAEQQAALETEAGDGAKRLHQQAYALGLDKTADELVAAGLAQQAAALSRTGVDGKPLVSPEAREKMLGALKETVTTARLMGAFSRLGSLEEKAKFIAGLEEDFAASRGLAKDYDLAGFATVKNVLERDLHQATTERNVAARVLADEIKTAKGFLEKGNALPDGQLAGLKARAASMAAQAPELAVEVAKAEDLYNLQTELRWRPPEEVDLVVRALRTEQRTSATPHGEDRLSVAEKLLGEMRGQLKEDPLGWTERTESLAIAPLDFADATGASFRNRVGQAEEVARYYGQAPVYLRPEEKRELANVIAQGGADGLRMAAMVAEAAGDRAPVVMRELSDTAPATAMLGGHVARVGMTKVARDAADGLALMKTETFKAMKPKPQEARDAAETVRRALVAVPEAIDAATTLANAVYEVRALRDGLSGFDERVWRKGLNELLGAREVAGETYGGLATEHTSEAGFGQSLPVIAPPNVRADRFFDAVDALTLDDLPEKPTHADGTPARLRDLRRATLVTVGEGRYRLALGDVEEDPRWLVKPGTRDPYVLDFNAVAPTLALRHPEWFLPGGPS